VKNARVEINGEVSGSIGVGFLVLLGVKTGDTEAEAIRLSDKRCAMRRFEDENERMNLSLADVNGDILAVSQFTLYGNCRRGRRPEFLSAAKPELAVPLYELFIEKCREKGFRVQTGVFGADMQVFSQNDGPVTLILDTDEL
jgi:D-tyrosyl-tRNA(Tyr) deacylase